MNIGPMVQDPLRIYPILKAGDQQGEEHKKVSEKFENQDDYKETWKIQIHQGDEIKKGHEDDSWVCDFTMTGLTKAKAGKTTIQIKLWVDEATGMLRGEGWETNLENAVVQQLEHQLDFKTISQEVNDAIQIKVGEAYQQAMAEFRALVQTIETDAAIQGVPAKKENLDKQIKIAKRNTNVVRHANTVRNVMRSL